MAPGDDNQPLSLRPPPVADRKPQNIAEFIARVNAQPGGFRAISEAELKEEIAQKDAKNGDAQDKDLDMADGHEDDEDEDQDALRDLQEVRMEMLKNLDIAGNTALLTLDFLSLLISKQNPTQAGVTLSQGLREMVGIGTMGADKLDNPPITPAKVQEQESIALGLTLMQTDKARDAAESASSFLQAEVTAEGRFWEDIASVQKTGWSISRVPQDRHTLGVRFGFSEAAPEYRNSLAPMRRGDDGTVQLDCGRLGGISERVVATFERNGQVTGRSALPAETTAEAPLEEHVLEARNTIFSQELWHELTREARTLAAYDVKPNGSRLICDIDPASKSRVILELVPLGSQASLDNTLPDNHVAETISLALHILLSYAHRQNELTRTRPMPPHISRSRGQQTHALLRPIIARLMHHHNVQVVTSHIGALVKSLQRAGIPSRFVLHTPPISSTDSDPANQGPNQLASSQTVIRNMLQPIEFNIRLTILPNVTFTVRGRTFHFPVTATYYSVITPPNSPLSSVCAPYRDGYPDPKALADYLGTATTRLLVEHYLSSLSAPWCRTIQGNVIGNANNEDFKLSFAVTEAPALRVKSISLIDGKLVCQEWTWSDDTTQKPLQEIVDEEIQKQNFSKE
ncbi:calcium channel yvc1 [Fusarium austroafricanum]|uniref:Mediator of RNA polymerase II transcription subunit 17 n=1 Tax=Fusarium austroafricanum TaxID=2364996 RepID=A0A8H4KJA4_9HYPO|nr:calcium channel yvc1 [Fusarium austroafricanum]